MSVNTKGALSSTTVQGAIIAGLPAIDAILVQVGVFTEPILTAALSAVVSAAGSLLAVWGRIKAQKKLKGWF